MTRPKLLIEYTSEMGLLAGQQAYSAQLEAEGASVERAYGLAAGVAGAERMADNRISAARGEVARTAYMARTEMDLRRAQRFASSEQQRIEAEAVASLPPQISQSQATEMWLDRQLTAQSEANAAAVAPGATPPPSDVDPLGVQIPEWVRPEWYKVEAAAESYLNNYAPAVAASYASYEATREITARLLLDRLEAAAALSSQEANAAYEDRDLVANWNTYMAQARTNNPNVTVPSLADLDRITTEIHPAFRNIMDTGLQSRGYSATD